MKNLFLISLLVLAITISVSAQNRIISGKVTSVGNRQPISGVLVTVRESRKNTLTEIDGTYKIEISSKDKVLIFSLLGMKTKEVNIKSSNVINVQLESEYEMEDELVESDASHKLSPGGAPHSLNIAGQTAPRGGESFILPPNFNTEEYDKIEENGFLSSIVNPLSTFSIDVDAASYSNLRRMINSGAKIYKDAVRIEEMINYFDYDYTDPKGEHPFSITTEVSTAPWNEQHQLVHIGLQGKNLDYEKLDPCNLVFLIDVSGSMSAANKLPLLKSSLKLLLGELSKNDKVALVTYAGSAGLVLKPTPATETETILKALNNLKSGGYTAGGEGIELAYKVAKENLIKDGNNRVILVTDGDFNVGVSSTSELVNLIEEKRKDGIYLTICGFGMGNYKDGRMEQISNAGNGNYFYIDNIREARKVFVTEMRATLFTIAKDVKIQIEFNPEIVQAYRLIGYENRLLNAEDFNDDLKDAGELGAGHTVTALYEIIPVGVESKFVKDVDNLKYQSNIVSKLSASDELMTVKFRYKKPEEDKSCLITHILKNKMTSLNKTTDNFRFSAVVAEFGMLLRDSEFKQKSSYIQVVELANIAKGEDREGYRSEFIELVKAAEMLVE